jgi:hypothetical protein
MEVFMDFFAIDGVAGFDPKVSPAFQQSTPEAVSADDA